MIYFVILLISALITGLIFYLSCHKEEIWEMIYPRKK